MKISVDGGALHQKGNRRFGTAVFSENLIKSLQFYDEKNIYHVYTFNNLRPKLFWMKGRVSIEELRENKDVFLALNQALPIYASGRIISFCHGLSYHFFPKYYPAKDLSRLNKQLKEMIKRSDKIIVSSEKIKRELISINKKTSEKIVVIPFGIPHDMIAPKKNVKEKYFLFVANDQGIKNADFVIKSFMKSKLKDRGYRLYMVGEWNKRENIDEGIISMGSISRKKLRALYQKASALLTSSYYESFNFPVLEALSLGCPVIGLESAVIPEFKEYVSLSKNMSGFIKNMEIGGKKLDVRSIDKIRKEFNWKKYVENLVRLY
jgi:glycosyltransferase involved in cell wall biosynthesis